MITLKSPREVDIMARAGRIVAGTLALMRQILRPGMTTEDLDAAAEHFIRSHQGAVP
jgi:methionyl aminopeptidase